MTEEVRGAIEVLKKAFKEDPGLVMAWRDVISACVGDAMGEVGIHTSGVSDNAANRVMSQIFRVRAGDSG